MLAEEISTEQRRLDFGTAVGLGASSSIKIIRLASLEEWKPKLP